MSEKMMIGNKEYDIEETFLSQAELNFYPENPRVYSELNVENGIPDQDAIEEIMTAMDHVKVLKESIKANGGLIDPLIVRDGDLVVLEGNSRLAAYRILARQDKIKWAKVKCKILPSDISDTAIFTLLGQYHIIGRKDWSPYEQAGYLHRRIQASEQPVDYIASELGISQSDARRFVEVYEFMIEHNDVHSVRWSYYDEYLRNRAIKKYRETMPLDDAVVDLIKKGQIKQAKDIRDVLGGVAKVTGRTANKAMKEIVDGKISIYQGFERVEDTGKTGNVFSVLNKFRQKTSEKEFKSKMKNENTEQIKYELKRIKKNVDDLLKELD